MGSPVYTEDEVSRKWCPFSRAVFLGEEPATEEGGGEIMVPHNRVFPHADGIDAVRGSSYCSCIGSDCMAWQWVDDPEGNMDPKGYCGLVRK